MLEVLGPALYERIEFQVYLKQHPNPWKGIAEVLYRSGEETRLNKLFAFVKSSEGNIVATNLQFFSVFNAIQLSG